MNLTPKKSDFLFKNRLNTPKAFFDNVFESPTVILTNHINITLDWSTGPTKREYNIQQWKQMCM